MCLNCSCLGMCVMAANLGLATLVASDQFFEIMRSWRFEERRTAVLFGTVFVVALYVPVCKKDLDVHATFIKNVTKTYGKDVEQGPEISTSPAISMWSWDYCVQTTRTTTTSFMIYIYIYMDRFSDVETTKADSRNDVVWNYEGVQVQGYLYAAVKKTWPSTIWKGRERKEGAAG